MRHVCVPCGQELRCKKNHVAVEVARSPDARKLAYGDLWKCPDCDYQIVMGLGKPFAEETMAVVMKQ